MRNLSVAADRRCITERISALKSPDRALWGRMTVDQMVCHLCDAFRLPLGEKSAADMSTLFSRTILKFAALRLPAKWPHGIPTMPEVEQGVGGTAPVEFEKDRAALLSLVDRYSKATFDPAIHHPIFGRMSGGDWLRLGYLHADHHLRQFGR
jgi:Protein of unknown function (DUF1569)